ncbi:MAG TPA: hypothetical protein VLL52_10710 [Anaerolineae bacterium]|nr:hypothetical protein [Anaerolineae bacterium]
MRYLVWLVCVLMLGVGCKVASKNDTDLVESEQSARGNGLESETVIMGVPNVYPAPMETVPNPSYGVAYPAPRTTPVADMPERPTPDCHYLPQPSTSELTGEMDDSLALRWLYGGGDCIDLEKQEVYTDNIYGRGSWKYLMIRPLISGRFEQKDGVTKYMLLTETIYTQPGSCNICRVIIGGVVVAKRDGVWVEEMRNEYIMEIGQAGIAPPRRFLQIGSDQYGVIFYAYYTSTGTTTESVIVVTPIDNELENTKSLHTGEIVHNHYPEPRAYTSTVEFVPDDRFEFYPIKMVSAGSKYIDNVLQPFEEVNIYVFQDGAYILYEEGHVEQVVNQYIEEIEHLFAVELTK